MCEVGKMTKIEIVGLTQRVWIVGNIFFSVTYKLDLKFFRVHKTCIILFVILQNMFKIRLVRAGEMAQQ